MAVPDLYWYGREGKWFGMRQFTVYMLDGVVQVCSFWSRQVCISDSHSTVCNYLLHHFIHLFHYLGADGWLAGGSVRILYCSSDFSCFFPSRLLINNLRTFRLWSLPPSSRPISSMDSIQVLGQPGFSLPYSLVMFYFGSTR